MTATPVPTRAMPAHAMPPGAVPKAEAPIPFGRLLKVEWRKSTDTRAARWLLLAVAVLTLGAVLIPLLMPNTLEQTLEQYIAFPAIALAALLPVVSILTLTSEWARRTVLTTFTQEPRRPRVLAAKLLSGLILALAGSAFGAAVITGGLALSDALGRDASWTVTWQQVVGFVAFMLLNVLWGMGFGALLHNTAAAIALFYVLPTLWTLISIGPVRQVGEWLDTTRTFAWVLTGDWSGHTGQILTSVAVWIALPLTAGLIRTVRREVT